MMHDSLLSKWSLREQSIVQIAVLRTVCNRTAFQESSSDFVRISLDDELQMIGELDASRAPGDWCRDERCALTIDLNTLPFPDSQVCQILSVCKVPSSFCISDGKVSQAPKTIHCISFTIDSASTCMLVNCTNNFGSSNAALRQSGVPCRSPLLPDQVVNFPYCVVEIKLRTEEPPSWISDLVASGKQTLMTSHKCNNLK